MPFTSSEEDDARWDRLEEQYGPLCPYCMGRVTDGYCDDCGREIKFDD